MGNDYDHETDAKYFEVVDDNHDGIIDKDEYDRMRYVGRR